MVRRPHHSNISDDSRKLRPRRRLPAPDIIIILFLSLLTTVVAINFYLHLSLSLSLSQTSMRFSAHHIYVYVERRTRTACLQQLRGVCDAGWTTPKSRKTNDRRPAVCYSHSRYVILLSSQTIIIIIVVVLFGVGMPPTVCRDIVIYASRDNGHETGLRKELF